MKRLVKLAILAIGVYAVATEGGRERLKRAREAYSKAVASGARPIEAVGTSIAAFVGLAEGGTSHTHPSPGVTVEEPPSAPSPINPVGTSTAASVDSDPEKPEKGHDDAFDLLHPHGRSKPEKKKPEKP